MNDGICVTSSAIMSKKTWSVRSLRDDFLLGFVWVDREYHHDFR